MDQATHNKIVSFIWGIADDVLRDFFKRGKYPDVILPMCVTRRMDAVLEPTKKGVLENKRMLDDARITEQRAALYDEFGDELFTRFAEFAGTMENRLADWGGDEHESDDENGGNAKKGLPEKRCRSRHAEYQADRRRPDGDPQGRELA